MEKEEERREGGRERKGKRRKGRKERNEQRWEMNDKYSFLSPITCHSTLSSGDSVDNN